MRKFTYPMLVQFEIYPNGNAHTVSRQYCNGNVHANDIIIHRILQLDPFQKHSRMR